MLGTSRPRAATSERHQAAVAQALAEGAMQRHGAEAFLYQVVGQPVTFHLGAGEHDGLVHGGVAQRMVQQLALVGHVVGPQQRLRDRRVFFMRRVDLDTLGLAHHARGQLHDARRKRGAEHHGLLALDGELVDFGQVVGKAEVQHAVGFVDHEELHLVELDLHAALQVQQAAGRGHHEVGVLQLGDLQLVRNAAHHVGDAQAAAMAHQVDRVGADLLGQLAGRAQDQGAGCGGLEVARVGRVLALGFFQRRLATGDGFGAQAFKFGAFSALGFFLLLEQGVQHGQQESGGLAAAGLAGNQQVGEFGFGVGLDVLVQRLHGLGDGGHLHGGRLGETHVGHGLQQFTGQAQFHETVGFRGNRVQRSFASGRRVGNISQHMDVAVGNDVVHRVGSCFGQRIAASLKRVSHVFSH